MDGLATLLAGLLIGVFTVAFVVSKAALVFSGALAPHLGQGIGLVLLGATLMAGVTLLSSSCRSVIVQPQDVTAVLLATTAGSLAAGLGLRGEAELATVLVLIGLSTLITGATAYAVGHLKLAFVVRYVPQQVTAGFLAASGVLLLREAFAIVLPADSPSAVSVLVAQWPRWLPWAMLALVLSVVARVWRQGVVVPLAMALAALGFYALLWVKGIDFDVARSQGWMLGPFPHESLLQMQSMRLLHEAQWHALLPLVPMMLAVAGLCLLGALLNIISLELVSGRESNLDQEFKTLGVANAAAGLVGGLPGYHLVGMTSLARRMGMHGAAAGLSVLIVSVLCLLFGAELLADLPRGLAAAVIWYLGFDLLLAALWDYGRRIGWHDRALVGLIPVVALTLGILPAIGLGILAACLLFVFVYSKIDAVRLFTTATHLRARVERGPEERERLKRSGDRIHVYKLAGFLFFGSAQRLLARLTKSLQDPAPPKVIVVDMKRIVGLDLSAWDAFERLSRHCAGHQVQLILTGLSARLQQQFGHRMAAMPHPQFVGDLDSALGALEEQDLAETDAQATESDESGTARDDLVSLMRRHGQALSCAAGQTILHEGDPSDSVMLLQHGQLDVSIAQADGGATIVNRMLPGALFGEVGYYAQNPRSATVTAGMDSKVLVLSADRLLQLEQSDPAAAALLHEALARVVARRLIAATQLLRDADL